MSIAYALPPVQQWAVRYDKLAGVDIAVDIALGPNGSSYVTGSSTNGTFHSDWATAKYDANGNQLWLKTYSSTTNGYDEAKAIAVDSAGNAYVAGSRVPYDIAVIKYGPTGNVIWTRIYDSVGHGNEYPTDLTIDGAGNVYVTGPSWNSTCCGDDYITLKYNASGTLKWAKRYNGLGSNTDKPTAIAVDQTGNVYVTGYTYAGASTEYDYTTIKYNATGVQQWVKGYTGLSTGSKLDYGKAIAIDPNGNILVTGQSGAAYSGSSAGDYATVKYNPAGAQQWVKRFDGNAHATDEARAIAVDKLGNVFVTGWSYTAQTGVQTLQAFATIKYSPAGTQQWIQLFRGPNKIDEATAIALDITGNVYVTGKSWIGSFGDSTYATVKYDTNGAQQWAKSYDGSLGYEEIPSAIAVDSANNVYVTGWSYGATTGKDYATIKYSQP